MWGFIGTAAIEVLCWIWESSWSRRNNISVNIQCSSSPLLLNRPPLSRMLNQRCYIANRDEVKVNPCRQLPCTVSLCGEATFQYRFRLLLELKCAVLCATWSFDCFCADKETRQNKTKNSQNTSWEGIISSGKCEWRKLIECNIHKVIVWTLLRRRP